MIKINNEPIELNKFPDGTFLIKEEPRSDKAIVSWHFENNEELVALIYISQHLRSHGVKTIHLFMPYIPNARQDRVKTKRDVFTLKYFAWVINSLNFDKVIVLDPHSSVSEALIDRIEIMSPAEIIKEVIHRICLKYGNGQMLMFYPDEGAMKRYSDMIPAPYAFGIKERMWDTGEIKGFSVFDCGQPIENRNVLIVDDICSRGGTFFHSANKLKELGAAKIFLFVTHCENTILNGELLSGGLIERVYTTDSLFTGDHNKIEVIKLENQSNASYRFL